MRRVKRKRPIHLPLPLPLLPTPVELLEKIAEALIEMNQRQYIIWYNIIGHGSHDEPLHNDLIDKMKQSIIYITIVIAGMCAFRNAVIEHAENGLLRHFVKQIYGPFTEGGVAEYTLKPIQNVDVTDIRTGINYFEFIKICLMSYYTAYQEILSQYKIDNITNITIDLNTTIKKKKQLDQTKSIIDNLTDVIEKAEQMRHPDIQPVVNNRYFFDHNILGADDYLKKYRPTTKDKLEFSMIGPITTNNMELNSLFVGNNFNFVSVNNILSFTETKLTQIQLEKAKIVYINGLLKDVITILADIDIFNVQDIKSGDIWFLNISTEELFILTFLIFNIEFMEIIHECITIFVKDKDMDEYVKKEYLIQGYNLFIEYIFNPCNNTRIILTTTACRYNTKLSHQDSITAHHSSIKIDPATQDVERANEFLLDQNGIVTRKKLLDEGKEQFVEGSGDASTIRKGRRRRRSKGTSKGTSKGKTKKRRKRRNARTLKFRKN